MKYTFFSFFARIIRLQPRNVLAVYSCNEKEKGQRDKTQSYLCRVRVNLIFVIDIY